MDDNLSHYARFGGNGVTNLNPIVLIVIIMGGLLICFVPRKYIVVPFFLLALLIPIGQQFVIGGLHIFMLRILILFGWIRAFLGVGRISDSHKFRLNTIDKLIVTYGIIQALAFTLLWSEWAALVNQLGQLFNMLGTYFFLRMILKEREDIDRMTSVFAVICAIVCLSMLAEQVTHRNAFSVLGGVPSVADVRDGSVRAQGPFEHPIVAGTFGAVMMPFFWGRWWRRAGRPLALLGLISAVLIAVASRSSTPIGALVAACAAFMLWPLRESMRKIRWAIVATLVVLDIIMKAPVWALIERFNPTGSSSGYHRYILIDNFIRRISEWWLFGVRDTVHWGYDMWDVSNQYVSVGVTGGIFTFVLFLAIITYCFKGIGRARKASESARDLDFARNIWTLGAALFANLTAFIGIVYFDQIQVAWFALLAMIATATFDPNMVSVASPEAERGAQFGISINRKQNQNVFANIHSKKPA